MVRTLVLAPVLLADWADIIDDARDGATDADLDVGEEMC